MEGGRTQNKELTHPITVADHRNTHKNNRKNRNTRKQKKHKKLSARMRLPIGTSSMTCPITEDVRKSIEKYKLEIEERHRNGMY
jgi:hypothetical protein